MYDSSFYFLNFLPRSFLIPGAEPADFFIKNEGVFIFHFYDP